MVIRLFVLFFNNCIGDSLPEMCGVCGLFYFPGAVRQCILIDVHE